MQSTMALSKAKDGNIEKTITLLGATEMLKDLRVTRDNPVLVMLSGPYGPGREALVPMRKKLLRP